MPVYSSTLGRMSQAPRRTAIALIAALTAVVMSGCGAPAPTPTPTALSEAEAYAAAEATYRAYVDALNRVDLSDPTTFEPVFALTTGEALAADRKTFSDMHARAYSVSGNTRVQSIVDRRFDSSTGVVELAVCQDVSQVHVVDESGNSVVSPDRPDIQQMRLRAAPLSSGATRALITSFGPDESGVKC
ncbi:MAG: hypothetical protein CMH36_07200 [Microbacterium sp.]|nr:hypothetical protein ASF93_04240 [Microbacterium sp. Leaf347]KQR97047.1 hypothetical protein ASG00_12095 [Microbacterium sp. Leaf351]MAL06597.1 hypothetical protein [Microbacterium sp.]OJU78340.1 MAG: hypothetical protein BGO15_04010 [Microbacterium sp. 71-23]